MGAKEGKADKEAAFLPDVPNLNCRQGGSLCC